MKERPILFSAPMVRAILAGAKTQTRRLVRDVPDGVIEVVPSLLANRGDLFDFRRNLDNPVAMRCPHGAPGDRLWVKETWRTSLCCDDRAPSTMEVPGGGYGWPIWYVADGGEVTWRGAKAGGPGFTTPGKTRVSIHMPRWASRITLEITDVRAQRLQDISDADARAEGVATPADAWPGRPVYDFSQLWDSINGERAAWASNPWVWAITFKRVTGEVRS